ncbi:6328_t:CDS:2 [Funneliformis mosseae]|uniref:6328_t:CDS:1 n=1 Tax=Funneliformis mosseae TaxID=27381 RepID=A0A9N9FX17_FUNMO|nr:6328_t:CDS:2 [Funneliformis mosseae]
MVGEVFALNKTDGTQVWNARLSDVGNVANLTDGAEVWRNPLSGMRYTEISVLVANTSSSKGSIVLVASVGKLGSELDPDVVLVGCGKRIYNINLLDGQTIWNQ